MQQHQSKMNGVCTSPSETKDDGYIEGMLLSHHLLRGGEGMKGSLKVRMRIDHADYCCNISKFWLSTYATHLPTSAFISFIDSIPIETLRYACRLGRERSWPHCWLATEQFVFSCKGPPGVSRDRHTNVLSLPEQDQKLPASARTLWLYKN